MTAEVSPETITRLQARVAEQREAIVRFMREICAIPSLESQIGPVGERIPAKVVRAGAVCELDVTIGERG